MMTRRDWLRKHARLGALYTTCGNCGTEIEVGQGCGCTADEPDEPVTDHDRSYGPRR
jgi:hypothetical protein